MLAKAKDNNGVKLGQYIITGGLIIQVVFFGFFIVVAGIFHTRITRYPTAKSEKIDVPWQRYLNVLYIASGLIMIRSIFRIAEYVMGQDGFLLKHEIFLYIFDSALMFSTMILFNLVHPSKIITRQRQLSSDILHDTEANNVEYPMARRNHQRATAQDT